MHHHVLGILKSFSRVVCLINLDQSRMNRLTTRHRRVTATDFTVVTFSGSKCNMELHKEKENYLKISEIVLEIVPKYLRILFKELWDRKYPEMMWQSSEASGEFLGKELGDKFFEDKKNKDCASLILKGNEQDWDTTMLARVMLDNKLDLIQNDSKVRQRVENLKKIRNDSFRRLSKVSYPSDRCADVIGAIKTEVKSLFGEDAEKEIHRAENLEDVNLKGKVLICPGYTAHFKFFKLNYYIRYL